MTLNKSKIVEVKHGIVLVGNFNPVIFQPHWFSESGIIRKEEADSAKVEVVHPEVSMFKLDWMRLNVQPMIFSVDTIQDAYYEIIRDFSVGTFRLLQHTPLLQLGINYNFIYDIGDKKKWNDFGHKLTPKELWGKFLNEPGMSAIKVEEKPIEHDELGCKETTKISISPESKLTKSGYGIFIQVNNHFQLIEKQKIRSATTIIDTLEKRWDDVMSKSKDIVENLIGEIS